LAEALPQTPLGGGAELTAFPDPLAGFMGLREGEKNGKGAQERGIGIRESEKRGGEGRGKEGEEGEGREREDFRAPPQFQICHYTIAYISNKHRLGLIMSM